MKYLLEVEIYQGEPVLMVPASLLTELGINIPLLIQWVVEDI